MLWNLPMIAAALGYEVYKAWSASRGSPPGPASPPASNIPLKCTLYAVPEHELDEFLRTHSPVLHFTDYARKLAEAGHHDFSCQITAKGRELLRRYDGERIVVCADFE